MIRVGFSKDIHRLVAGRKLILGGVEIPNEKGELAHSDGDVLLHSLAESIIGALGLGDLGTYFPPEDKTTLGINSVTILKEVLKMMENEQFHIVNIDISIELESPKLKPYISEIKSSISNICAISSNYINVKAMTNEGLDATGNNLGIASYCVVLLEKK